MSSATSYPHLSVDTGGAVRIAGTRYKVLHLAAEHYHYGWSSEELLRQHPDLKPEEVYSALTYFYDHRDEMLEQMAEVGDKIEQLRPGQSLSREELLQRRRLTESA